MGQLAMILPILPGKKEKWLGMLNSMLAPGSDSRKEFNGKREAVGLHERTYLQETPNGDFMILTLDGENPETMTKSTGLAIIEISTALKSLKPDWSVHWLK